MAERDPIAEFEKSVASFAEWKGGISFMFPLEDSRAVVAEINRLRTQLAEEKAVYREVEERLAAAMSKLAEPEQPKYDYHDDWEYLATGHYAGRFECKQCRYMQVRVPAARHNCPEQPTPENETPKPKFRAEPDRAERYQPAPYDYHADWTRHPDPSGNNDVHWTCNYCGAYRDGPPKGPHADCYPDQPAPTEPVIDEAVVDDEVYEAAVEEYTGVLVYHQLDGPGRVEWTALIAAITAAIRKYEELRSKACGGSSERSSSPSSCSLADTSSAEPSSQTAAPAADPRRLTQDEVITAWSRAKHEPYPKNLAAVADAQLAKAKVTISEAEIKKQFDNLLMVFTTRGAINWLRSHGIEVVP